MIPCFFLSGAGNDFLALAEPVADPSPAEVRAWCTRGLSAGADGLFVLRRGGPARVLMRHYNADGGAAELCVNGTRCAARLAFHLGWAADAVEIVTAAGPVRARRGDGGTVKVEVPAPAAPPRPLAVEAAGRRWEGWRLTVGVPHFVTLWPAALAAAPVAAAGPALRAHPAFGAAGTNVDFVRLPARDRLEIRTFERGVEAETLACGSGILAAASCALAAGLAGLPLLALTAGGSCLEVRRGEAGVWSLAGDARLVWSGSLAPEAARLPSPPAFAP